MVVLMIIVLIYITVKLYFDLLVN